LGEERSGGFREVVSKGNYWHCMSERRGEEGRGGERRRVRLHQ
jgi:hypothetical protein